MSVGKNEERPPLGTEGAQENNGGDRDPCKVNSGIPGIDGAGDENCLLPSKDAVRAALRLIHPEGPWHVSAKREKGFTGKVYAPDAEGGAAGWAVAKNATLNAYVSIAALRPGWNGDKATKADVASVGWLWVDVDPRPGEELEPERARILANLTTNLPKGVPPPSAIIDSGRGFWGLWRLAQPVVMPPADDPAWDAARASVEDRNRGLELAFGADRCHNMERVMRLPGELSLKVGDGKIGWHIKALLTRRSSRREKDMPHDEGYGCRVSRARWIFTRSADGFVAPRCARSDRSGGGGRAEWISHRSC